MLFLPFLRPAGNAGQVADYACRVINVFTSALRAFKQTVLADMAALVADRVRNVEGEIRRPFLNGKVHQERVLRTGQMLFQVAMKRGTAVQLVRILASVQSELVYRRTGLVFNNIEI